MSQNDNQVTTDNYSPEIIRKYMLQATLQSFGGFAADLCSYPWYTLWIQKQSVPSEPTHKLAYTLFRKKQLYAGFSAQAISSPIGTRLYLWGRDVSLSLFGKNQVGYFMQGPIGVAFGTIVWAPSMRISTWQQAASTNAAHAFNQKSIFGKCKTIWQTEGLRSFYRGSLGWGATFALTDSIGSSLLGQILDKYSENDRSGVFLQFFATTIAFSFATLLTSPIEMITAHLRLHETNKSQFPHKKFKDAARHVFQTKGCRGFFHAPLSLVAYQTIWHLVIPLAEYIASSTSHNPR